MSKVKHYPRVSSNKQAEEGDSIEFQDKRLRQDSENKNDEIVKVITDEGKSASISDEKMKMDYKEGIFSVKIDIRKRPGFMEILDSINDSDWDTLKITKWDRLSRNTIFSQLMILYFKMNNKEIIAVDDSNDALVRDILGVLGQKEIEKLKGRIRDVRQYRFEKGMFPARSPYGYRPIKKDKKVVGFKIDPKEAKTVRECFNLTISGHSYSEICKRLKLKPQQYYNIIRNKSYCGYVSFEKQERKGIHEPIVS